MNLYERRDPWGHLSFPFVACLVISISVSIIRGKHVYLYVCYVLIKLADSIQCNRHVCMLVTLVFHLRTYIYVWFCARSGNAWRCIRSIWTRRYILVYASHAIIGNVCLFWINPNIYVFDRYLHMCIYEFCKIRRNI